MYILLFLDLDLMPGQLDHYKELWGLAADGDPFNTHSSLLQPILYNDAKCMLKIAVSDEERRGNNLMTWWNGNGAAIVLLHDDAALLMERANGERSLTEMATQGRDDEAIQIICLVVDRLHTHQAPYPTDLIPLNTWFKSLGLIAERQGGVFAQCSQVANELLNNPKNQIALHGDIHHGNILDFGEKGWLAIDPKGLIGERGFDYANLFCNPDAAIATDPGRFIKRIRAVSEAARLEPKRLLQWIAAWAALSAAWAIEDGENPEPALAVANLALNRLNDIA